MAQFSVIAHLFIWSYTVHYMYIVSASDKFECPANIFNSDVVEVTISCEAFPSLDSKLPGCFKDLWWKYVVYAKNQAPLIENPNVYDVVNVPACQKRCMCTLVISMNIVDCTRRGRPPRWMTDFATQQRTAFNCRQLKWPSEIAANADQIFLAVKLDRMFVQSESNMVLIEDLAEAFGDMGVDALEIIVNNDFTNLYRTITALDTFFKPGRFQNLASLTISVNNIVNPTWPTAAEALKNITSPKLAFLTVSDLVFTSIPSTPVMSNLQSLICHRCAGLAQVPGWFEEAKNLFFIHFTNTPKTFSLLDLPASNAVLSFTFANTPLTNLPDNFKFSNVYPQVQVLDLSNLNLSVVPYELFHNLPNLLRLDLSGNYLLPLPSFKGLASLMQLALDGYPIVYGSQTNFYLSNQCFLGALKNFVIKKGDLDPLTNLTLLSISYYQNVQIDDDAFVNLARLKKISFECASLKRLPTAMRSTCGIRWLNIKQNPFNSTDPLNPLTWPVPLFVSKYYKSLQEVYFSRSNAVVVPPSILLFNTTKSSRLFQSIAVSITNNPALSANQCEMYKIDRVFKARMTTATNLYDQTSPCFQEFSESMKIARAMTNNLTDFCARSP